MSAHPLPATRAGGPALWRPMAKVTWLQHRAALATVAVLTSAIALVVITASFTPRSLLDRLSAGGCFTALGGTSCSSLVTALSNRTGGLSLATIVLLAIPALAGTFIGAPLLARELESGTFRFAWTQEIGRNRWLAGKLVLLGAVAILPAAALGVLTAWYASPFNAAGLASHWQAGQFTTTGLALAAWSLLALTAGIFLGLVTGRVVAAMAATVAATGGLSVLNFWRLNDYLLAVGPRTTRTIPSGTGNGPLNTFAAPGGIPGPRGSWLVSGWYTGPHGGTLGTTAVTSLQNALYYSRVKNPAHWLAQHHVTYWVSYQPASRFWAFQGIEAATLAGLAILLAAATVWLARRRFA